MNGSIDTALREFIEIIKDRQWHDLYEFHETYRLSAASIFSATSELLRFEIIIKCGHQIKLSDNLKNQHLSLINKLQKTKRPKTLNIYDRST